MCKRVKKVVCCKLSEEEEEEKEEDVDDNRTTTIRMICTDTFIDDNDGGCSNYNNKTVFSACSIDRKCSTKTKGERKVDAQWVS